MSNTHSTDTHAECLFLLNNRMYGHKGMTLNLVVVQLAGYKVKCMLAEPKGKRGRADSGGGSLDNGPTWQVC